MPLSSYQESNEESKNDTQNTYELPYRGIILEEVPEELELSVLSTSIGRSGSCKVINGSK